MYYSKLFRAMEGKKTVIDNT